jgi:ABC-type transport system involved in cytochrome c biogenesis permease subunit
MHSARLVGGLDLLMALAAILSIVPPAFSRASHEGRRPRSAAVLHLAQGGLLIVGIVLIFLTATGAARRIAWGWSAPALALAAGGLGAALASLVYGRRVRLMAGGLAAILIGLALGVSWSNVTSGVSSANPPWPLAMAQVIQASASGWLATTALGSALKDRGRRAIGGALLLHTGALLTMALYAQQTWGQGWSWDPLECWMAIPWLCTAMVGVVMEHLAPKSRRKSPGNSFAVLIGVAAVVGLIIAVGAPYLTHMMAIGSRYLR